MSKILIPSTKIFKLRKYKPRMEAFKDRIEQALNTLSGLYIIQNTNIKSNNMVEKEAKDNPNKKIDSKDSSLNKNIKIKKYKLLDQGTSTKDKEENDHGNENESNSNEKIEDIENKKTKEDNKDNKVENEEDGNTKVHSDKIDNSEISNSINENNNKENIESKEIKESKESEKTEENENINEKNKHSKEINNINDDKTNITNVEENDNNNINDDKTNITNGEENDNNNINDDKTNITNGKDNDDNNNIQDNKTNIINGEENNNNNIHDDITNNTKDEENDSNNSKKDIAKANENEKNIVTIDKKDKSELKKNSNKKINININIKKNSKIIKNNYNEPKDNEKEIILPFIYKIRNMYNKLNEIKNNSNITEDNINDEISLLADRGFIELSLAKFRLTKKYESIKELYDKQSKQLSKLIEENISQRNIIEKFKKKELENNNKINNLNDEIKILKTKLYNSYEEIQNYQQQLKKSNNIKSQKISLEQVSPKISLDQASPKISLEQTIKNILNKKDSLFNDTLKKKFNNNRISLNPNFENILSKKEKSLKRTNSDFVKLKEENNIDKIENGISDYRNKKAFNSPLNKININLNNNDSQSTSRDYFPSLNTSRQRNKYPRFNNSSLDYDTLNIASGYKRFEMKNSVNLNNINSLLINSSRRLTPLKIKNSNILYNNGENN